MITDSDRYRQDKSPYERPNFPYRCGRISFWGKPCSRGPNGNGSCGGTSECMPYLDGERWECRRSAQSGGPCEEGPLPDGQCCHRHPPCKPVPTLRGYRGRFSMLVVALILALIGAFAMNGDDARAISSISPGALSSGHAQFTGKQGCAACHAPHGGDAAAWVRAAWSPNGLTQSCESCHAFDGPAAAAHNETFETAGNQRRTQCTMCHTEHKGADADITKMADPQCNACHKTTFDSFSSGHPAFSKNYPSRRRTAIAFNHVTHFNKYFQYKRYAEQKPKERCISCHDARQTSRDVPVRPFEETCAGCHAEQIPKRDLVIFTVPEFAEDPFDAVAVGEACGGIAGETDKAAGDDEYLSVSEETLPPIAVMLLDLEDGEDADAYAEPVGGLVMAMIEDGVEPFVASVEGRPDSAMLFAGLSPELLRQAGCAWAANQEYEAQAEPSAGGWFADELSLRYRPLRHGDPVVKAWARLAAAGGDGVGEALRDEIFSREKGPGACAKCHSVNVAEGEPGRFQVAWRFGARSNQRHVRFSHAPHLNLLGLGKVCETCHKVDETADYDAAFKHFNPLDFASNFKPIERTLCTACHAEAKVRQDCTLCHEYHNGHSFNRRMISAGRDQKR